jgi:hypothetical protein
MEIKFISLRHTLNGFRISASLCSLSIRKGTIIFMVSLLFPYSFASKRTFSIIWTLVCKIRNICWIAYKADKNLGGPQSIHVPPHEKKRLALFLESKSLRTWHSLFSGTIVYYCTQLARVYAALHFLLFSQHKTADLWLCRRLRGSG